MLLKPPRLRIVCITISAFISFPEKNSIVASNTCKRWEFRTTFPYPLKFRLCLHSKTNEGQRCIVFSYRCNDLHDTNPILLDVRIAKFTTLSPFRGCSKARIRLNMGGVSPRWRDCNVTSFCHQKKILIYTCFKSKTSTNAPSTLISAAIAINRMHFSNFDENIISATEMVKMMLYS